MKIIQWQPNGSPRITNCKPKEVETLLRAYPQTYLSLECYALHHTGKLFAGPLIVTGINDRGEVSEIQNMDHALQQLFGVCRYERIDPKHNVWRCRHCGHMEQLESDGPWENGWNICPHCAMKIKLPEDLKKGAI